MLEERATNNYYYLLNLIHGTEAHLQSEAMARPQ